ncbi:hypothetical protein MPH_06951 [Macrophomina phaseolina MS6]|uniref:Uncharacterized protein n=1 Tax=Macrophomina phaseolina (strain MS6) TaxID=1126212 RepID=K2RM92_MACPH|nr:hypothetical protein MPH_06951 [Macrophomina phaseolina MS6]
MQNRKRGEAQLKRIKNSSGALVNPPILSSEEALAHHFSSHDQFAVLNVRPLLACKFSPSEKSGSFGRPQPICRFRSHQMISVLISTRSVILAGHFYPGGLAISKQSLGPLHSSNIKVLCANLARISRLLHWRASKGICTTAKHWSNPLKLRMPADCVSLLETL